MTSAYTNALTYAYYKLYYGLAVASTLTTSQDEMNFVSVGTTPKDYQSGDCRVRT
jgi:hypothetical protein